MIGVPDERLGERVAAFVVLVDGADWPGPEAVLAHLDQARLARQKFPVEWPVVDALPVTLSGKVQKHKLARGAADCVSTDRLDESHPTRP